MNYSEWKELNEKFLSSKLTVIEFCRKNKINRSHFYMWKKKFQKDEAKEDVQDSRPRRPSMEEPKWYLSPQEMKFSVGSAGSSPNKKLTSQEEFERAATKEDLKHIEPECSAPKPLREYFSTAEAKGSLPPIYPIHTIIRITLHNGIKLEIENNCNIEQLKTIIEALDTLK